MTMLKDMLGKDSFDMTDVGATLDALDEATLVRETQSLGLKEQRALFDAAKGFRALTLTDIVPEHASPGTQVIHQGKNTLPMFSVFQKRFTIPEAGSSEIWGINVHTFGAFTGPGYFVAGIKNGECVIDYNRVPPKVLPGWPRVKENKGFWGLTYGRMIDTLRGVSRRVTIGNADKQGKDMGRFVLVRLGG